MPTIVPNLWFDGQAEEAAAFYTSVFPNSHVLQTARYPANSPAAMSMSKLDLATLQRAANGETASP